MNPNSFKHKIKVFISSQCGDKYTIVRKALENLLLETGIVESYCFETETASSVSIPDDYLEQLIKSDVVLLLIDRKDGVSPAVMKEFQVAKENNIRLLVLINDENSKEQLPIEKEIISSKLCHFETIHEFSDFAFYGYRSLISDLIKNYGIKQILQKEDINKEVSIDNSHMQIIVDKNLLQEFKSTKETLLYLIMGGNLPSENSSLIDTAFSSFLKVLLCESPFDGEDFQKTSELIVSKHSEPIKNIVKVRLNCVSNYWQGNIHDIVTELTQLLNTYKDDKTISTWIINDIAIDLRNQERFVVDNYGQQVLDNSLESVYFPILDRLETNLENNIIKFYREVSLENPYSSTTTSLSYIFNDLASYYCLSLYYGSITHLLITRRLLQDLLYSMFVNRKDVRLFEQIVKYDVLIHDEKHLESLIRKNKSIWLNFIDYSQLLKSINYLQNEENQNLAKLEVIKNFGLLLNDNDFDSLANWLFDFSLKFLNGTVNFMTYKESLKKGFNNVSIRLHNDKILEFILKLFESKKIGFVELGSDIFCCIRIKELTIEQLTKIKALIIEIITDDSIGKNINYFKENVLIPFCKNSSISIDDLTALIQEKYETFYNTIFKLELIDKENVSFIDHIDRYLDEIEKRVSTNQKNIILGYATNPCEIVKNIIHFENIDLNNKQLDKIINTTYIALFSEKQLIIDKCDSLSLLILLYTKYKDQYDWNACSNHLEKNKDKIMNCIEENFFDNSSKLQLIFYNEIIIGLVNNNEKLILQNIIKVPSMKDYDKIKCLELISLILDENYNIFSEKELQSIIQLACNLSVEDERDVCYYSTKILCLLVNSAFQEIILDQLSNLMNFANVFSRKLIVDQLLPLKNNKNKQIETILVKSQLDRNYYIRQSLE